MWIVIGSLLIGCIGVVYENHSIRKQLENATSQLTDYSRLVLRYRGVGGYPLIVVSLEDIRLLHMYGDHPRGHEYSILYLGAKPDEINYEKSDLTLEYRIVAVPMPLEDPRLGKPPETNENGTEIR